LASPPAIGGTAAAAGTFTTLSSTGNTTIGDAVADTITVNGQFVTGTILRSAQTATNTLALAAYDTDGAAYTNLITLTASTTPTLALTSTGVGTINNMSIGATTASTGAFSTVTATGDITIGSAAVTSRMFRALEIGGAGNNAGIAFGNNGAKGSVYGASGGNGLYIVGGTGGPLLFGYAAGDASLNANYLSLGVWNTTGLGIGVTPTRTLEVSAALATVFVTSSTGTNRVYYGASNTGGGTYFGRENSAGNAFGTTAYASVVWSEGAYPLVFATNNVARVTIDSAGSLNLSGSYTENVVAIGNSGTSKTIDLGNGTLQTVTMTGNCTFTMPTATAGKSFVLIVSSGAGGFTGTFTSVKWPNNTAPTLTTTATRWDILTFVANGSAWYGNFAQAYA
jgi:hypothetical protein